MKTNTKKPQVGDIIFVREGERIKNPSNANDRRLNNRFISKDYGKIIMLNSSKAHPIHRGFVKLEYTALPHYRICSWLGFFTSAYSIQKT